MMSFNTITRIIIYTEQKVAVKVHGNSCHFYDDLKVIVWPCNVKYGFPCESHMRLSSVNETLTLEGTALPLK